MTPDRMDVGTWHSVKTSLGGGWHYGPWTFASQGSIGAYPGFFREDGTCIPYHAVVKASRVNPNKED